MSTSPRRVANLGSNVFLIHKFPIISDAKELLKATRRNRDITWDDYEALRDNLKLPKGVGVEVRRTANVRTERQNLEDVDLRGVTANIGDMDVEEVAQRPLHHRQRQRASRHGLHDRHRRGRQAVRQHRSAGQDPDRRWAGVPGRRRGQADRQHLRPVAGQFRLHPHPDLAEDLRPQHDAQRQRAGARAGVAVAHPGRSAQR